MRNRGVFWRCRNLLSFLDLRFLSGFCVTFCPFCVRILRQILPAFCVKFGQNSVHRWPTSGTRIVSQESGIDASLPNPAKCRPTAQPSDPGKLVIPPFRPPADRQHSQQPAALGADLVGGSAVDQVADVVHSANSPAGAVAGAVSGAAVGSAGGGVMPSTSAALALPLAVSGAWK